MATLITIFQQLKATNEPRYLSIESALDRIIKGKSRKINEALRLSTNDLERAELKKQLPCICFAGRFTRRANEAIVTHSGLIVLDFDKLPNVAESKRFLVSLPFAYAVWLSPSGNGLKMLVRIPANITAHRGHFVAIQSYLAEHGLELDQSGKDVARVCFESYDPDLYHNPDADPWTDYSVPEDTPPVAPQTAALATNYGELNKCVNKIRRAVDGQKHPELVKAATLAGGLIAGGIVREEDAIRLLEDEIRNKPNVVDFRSAQKTIRDQIAYGKTRPIFTQVAEELPPQQTDSTNNIVYLPSQWDRMKEQFKTGKERGVPTHMFGMDGRFSWKKGELTLFSGLPGSGKSEFALQLALLMSLFDGWKWAVFSPENDPADEFYDTLIHSLVGKSTDPAYANQMNEKQYAEAANFIAEHFYFIHFPTAPTAQEIESNIVYCIEKYGVKGAICDPYNAMKHDDSRREDQYLRDFLNDRASFAKLHQICYVWVCHPNGDVKLNNKNEYNAIGYYQLSGGSMWGNKVHNFIVVHRPHQNLDPGNSEVEIIVRKIKKQKLVGTPGTVLMDFDRATNRYLFDGRSPLSFINSNAEGLVNGQLKP